MLHSFLSSKLTGISCSCLISDIYFIIQFYVSEEFICIVTLMYGIGFLQEKVVDVTCAKIFAIVIL